MPPSLTKQVRNVAPTKVANSSFANHGRPCSARSTEIKNATAIPTGTTTRACIQPVTEPAPTSKATFGSSEHGRPWFANDEFATFVGATFLTCFVKDGGIDAEEGQRGRSGFGRSAAGKRRNHDGTSLSLPPGIDDGTTSAADLFVIPHPGFRIDGFTDGAKQAERGKIVRVGELIARFNEGTNGGRRGVENSDAVFLDNVPEPSEVGVIRSAFIHDLGHSVGERTVGDVGMPGDPADVGSAPIDVVILHIENVFAGGVSAGEVSAGSVENTLGLSGGSGGVENEKRVLAVEAFSFVLG